MKNIIYLLLSLFLLISCNKEEPIEEKNQIIYKGQSVSLKSGYINIRHEKILGPDFDIVLLDREVSKEIYEELVNESLVNIDALDGVNGIWFYLEEDQHGFNYLNSGHDCIESDNLYAGLFFDFNAETLESSKEIDVNSGSFCLTKQNDVFIIEFDCKDKDGNPVNGYFSGSLHELNTYDN